MAQPVSASLAGPVPAPRPMLWAWPGPRGGFPVDVSVGHVSGFRPPEPSLRCRSCGISRSPRAFAHQGLTFRPLFHPSGSSHRSGSRHHPPPPRSETTADRPLPARRGKTSMRRGKEGGDKVLGSSISSNGFFELKDAEIDLFVRGSPTATLNRCESFNGEFSGEQMRRRLRLKVWVSNSIFARNV